MITHHVLRPTQSHYWHKDRAVAAYFAVAAAILLCTIVSVCDAQAQAPYFYKGRNYGSEAMYNPISLVLNAGFDMIQVSHDRDITRIPFYAGGKNVFRNLGNPFGAISRYGWEDFLRDQVIPLGLSKDNGQWWPNYTLHLVGGGMTYVAMTEWYEAHEFPEPKLFSMLSMVSYHLVNEITENGAYEGDNVDPIADIYLFDLGGIVLFSFESVQRFFSEELNLADWSLQPSFSLRNLNLHNNGQFFSVKWKFPFSERWHLFYYFGTNGVGGLSYKRDDGSFISVGIGLVAKDLIDLDKLTNKKTLDLVPNIGVFYDVGNSLMASLSVSKKTDYMVNVNIYPGLLKIGDFSPGFWMSLSSDARPIIGVTTSLLPVGIAYHGRLQN
jgi:hypothetical protein